MSDITKNDMEPQPYDRDPTLQDLITATLCDSISRALTPLLRNTWHLIDNKRQPIMASPDATNLATPRYALCIELEPLGYLVTDAAPEVAQAACALITALLKERWRYQMSADLHLEITQADFAELQHRHDLLQASEQRYRELSEQLEIRVAEQVETIEQQQLSLFQAEKLAAVGQLAAGVAHEINNPIGFVKSNLSAAHHYFNDLKSVLSGLRQPGGGDIDALWRQHDLDFLFQDSDELFKESIDGVERVAKIVAALKEFSAVDSLGLKQVDINVQIRNVCELAQMQVASVGTIEQRLTCVPLLSCQAGAINQALLNLITNALQATRSGGKVIVSTQADADQLHISIEDTGVGIAPELHPHIFEPFFTTRPVGEGKGLGLKVCRDVALAHHGTIDFSSAPGQGTRFTLHLPLMAGISR